jgi:hypothetical protein
MLPARSGAGCASYYPVGLYPVGLYPAGLYPVG